MVAIFIGAVVIAGVYAIFANSQRIFHQEGRIAQAQLGARTGLELLKNDLRRAGYLSSPNPTPDPANPGSNIDPLVCFNHGLTGIQLQPVIHTNGTAGKVLDSSGMPTNIAYPSRNADLAPDAVVLVGNYINTRTFLAQTINAPAGSIRLQTLAPTPPPGIDPEGATWSGSDPIGDSEFARMFPASVAFVRVLNRHGRMMFAPITGTSSATDQTVFVPTDALNQVSQTIQCGVEGYGEGSEVNVVNAILYRVEIDTTEQARDQADPGTPFKKTDLVRYMLDQNLQVIPETREIVIEYVVDFQVWYRQDDPTGASGTQPNIDMQWTGSLPEDERIVIDVPLGASPTPLDGSASAKPENLRSAIIKISVRTAEEDPEFPFIMRAAGEPLVRFELNPNTEGAAHVRTLVTEVNLPNIAFRNLRN
jgi:hypothetical protein